MTLRKVTDESAVEEGGREVALKKGRAEREGGRQARSITVLKKKPLKIFSWQEKSSGSQVTTRRHLRKQESKRV